MIYFTSDLHFNHDNILQYCNRPANVFDLQIKNWNATVKEHDEIYILGNFTFKCSMVANEVLSKLNGKEFFVRGNHDKFVKKSTFQHNHFEWVKDYYHFHYEIDGKKQMFVLSHYPFWIWNGQEEGAIRLLKSIYGYVKNSLDKKKVSDQDQFKVLIPHIKGLFFDEKLCFDKLDNQGASILYILGSGFHEKIMISEVITRIETSYNKYGARAIQAEKNENVDWKDISHAMRCILQIKELAQTKQLIFPLSEADYLIKIKAGKFSWKECEKSIADWLIELDTLVTELPQNLQINQIHEKTILSYYQTSASISSHTDFDTAYAHTSETPNTE